MDLEKVMIFLRFSNDFRKTERLIYAVDDTRNENDVEHSFQVALTAWYLNDSYKFKLNMEKVLKYAIAHDLLESYTGDFHFNIQDAERKNKIDREGEALEIFKKEFPETKTEFKGELYNFF